MIKTRFGNTVISGTKIEIRADFSTLVHSLFNDNILTKEEIEEDLQRGLVTREELDYITEENMQRLMEVLKDKLEELNQE